MSSALVLLSVVAYALAQDASDNGSQFAGNSVTATDLSVWCIFSAVFLVETVLCFHCLIRGVGARGQRLSYAFLASAFLLNCTASIAEVANIVISFNADVAASPRRLLAVEVLSRFLWDWNYPLLFLGIMGILADRYTAVYAAGTGAPAKPPLVYGLVKGVLVALMLGLGTTSAAMRARYNALTIALDQPGAVVTDAIINSLRHRSTVSRNVGRVFNAFWYVSVLEVLALGIVTYKAMRRMNVTDKVTKAMLFGVTPFYVLFVLQGIIFSIIFSSVGLHVTTSAGFNQLNVADMMNDLLYCLSYAGFAGVLVFIGLRRSTAKWTIDGEFAPGQGVKLQKWHHHPHYRQGQDSHEASKDASADQM